VREVERGYDKSSGDGIIAFVYFGLLSCIFLSLLPPSC
jgi:hypothetical protein